MQSVVKIWLFMFAHKRKLSLTRRRKCDWAFGRLSVAYAIRILRLPSISHLIVLLMACVNIRCVCVCFKRHHFMLSGWLDHQTTLFSKIQSQNALWLYFHSMVLAFAIIHSKPLLNWSQTKERKQMHSHTPLRWQFWMNTRNQVGTIWWKWNEKCIDRDLFTLCTVHMNWKVYGFCRTSKLKFKSKVSVRLHNVIHKKVYYCDHHWMGEHFDHKTTELSVLLSLPFISEITISFEMK